MSEQKTGTLTYSVLTAPQWRIHRSDITAAFRERGLKRKSAALMQIWRQSRIGRAMARYNYQRGRMAAGGIAYMALFSIAAIITVGWTIFAHFFSENPQFQASVVGSVNTLLPGVLADPKTGAEGLIDPEALDLGRGSLVVGLVAFGIAAWSASRIVRYIIDGMRGMFGLLPYPRSVVNLYLRYFIGLALLTLSVAVTAVLLIASTWFEGWIGSLIPLFRELHDSLSFDLAALLVPLIVNFVTVALFVRYVAAIRVPRRSLLWGAAAFSVAGAVLSALSGLVLGASDDPVIAAAATVGTLLLWLNILARVGLMVAAWMANPPAVIARVDAADVNANATPNYVTLSDPKTLGWPFHPISGDLIPALPVPDPDEEERAEHTAERMNPLEPDDAFGPSVAAWTTLWTEDELQSQQEAHDAEVLDQTKWGRRLRKAEKQMAQQSAHEIIEEHVPEEHRTQLEEDAARKGAAAARAVASSGDSDQAPHPPKEGTETGNGVNQEPR